MTLRFPWPARFIVALVCLMAVAAQSHRPCAGGTRFGNAQPPRPLTLDDAPEPLSSTRPPSEAEQDRSQALALYSTGRLLERRGDKAGALRRYLRALRYDPQAVSVAKAIIPLAARLERQEVVVRCALLVAEREGGDPSQLARLGSYLASKGQWDRAIALYEKVLALRQSAEPTASDVLWAIEAGRLYHLRQDHAKAAGQFARVVEAFDHPEQFKLTDGVKKALLDEPGLTYALFGESFLQADRIDDAVAAFRQGNELEPNAGRLEFNLARVEAHRNKPQQALAHLEAFFLTRRAEEGTAPYRLLEEVLKDLNEEGMLIDRLEKLHAHDAENAPLGYFLAEKRLKKGQQKEAAALYAAVLKKSPTRTGYQALVGIYRKTGRWEGLLDALAEVAGRGASANTLGQEGEALAADAQAVRRLLEIARRRLAAEKESFGFEHRWAAALLALDAEQWDDAAGFFEAAIQPLLPSEEGTVDRRAPAGQARPENASGLLLTWGEGLLVAQQYDRAVEVFRRGTELPGAKKDQAAEFQYYLAGALALAGKTEGALAAARKAVEIEPDRALFHGRAAWVLYHAKRRDEAHRAYEALLQRFDPQSGDEVRQVTREARLVLSNLCVQAGRNDEAEEWLEQVLDEFPDDIAAMNDLGYLWADQGDRLQRACRMLQAAVAQDPDNAAYRDSLGWVLFRLGRLDEALAELTRAAQADDDPVILDHLGDAYRAAGRPDEARDAWRRAVERFRQEEQEQEAAKVQEKLAGKN